jgi:hypothetical protein
MATIPCAVSNTDILHTDLPANTIHITVLTSDYDLVAFELTELTLALITVLGTVASSLHTFDTAGPLANTTHRAKYKVRPKSFKTTFIKYR